MPVLLLNQMCKRCCICFCKANPGKSQGGIVLFLDSMSCKAIAGLQGSVLSILCRQFAVLLFCLS